MSCIGLSVNFGLTEICGFSYKGNEQNLSVAVSPVCGCRKSLPTEQPARRSPPRSGPPRSCFVHSPYSQHAHCTNRFGGAAAYVLSRDVFAASHQFGCQKLQASPQCRACSCELTPIAQLTIDGSFRSSLVWTLQVTWTGVLKCCGIPFASHPILRH